MKALAKLLRFDFLPFKSDCGMLALRLWIGISMLSLHGWAKLSGFSEMSQKFPGLFGLSPTGSLALAVFGEFFGSILIFLGLFTRFGALASGITMAVAFFVAHHHVLRPGPGSGEMAFIYLGAYVAIFLGGPGRYSLDAKMGGKV